PVPARGRAWEPLAGRLGVTPARPLGPFLPGVAVRRVLAEGRQLLGERRPAVPRERGRDPDVVELAVVVVQPQQERADVRAGPVLVPPEAGHDAVGRPLVLDLQHRALARLVRRLEALGDDAVEAGALDTVEPICRGVPIARRRGEVNRWR